jgi:hypothetical protein
MDDALIPTSVPEETGDNQAATDHSNKEGDPHPKKGIPPGNGQPKKWLGLAETEWGGVKVFL